MYIPFWLILSREIKYCTSLLLLIEMIEKGRPLSRNLVSPNRKLSSN